MSSCFSFFTFSRLENIVVALRAAAEHIGLPVKNCVLVAGSQSGVSAAKMIGMPCVVMRSRYDVRFLMSLCGFLLLLWSIVHLLIFLTIIFACSLTARGEFPSAKGVMDGFGGADLTIPKLRHKIKS